jgi:Domain of unknown function (DUF6249)
MDFGTTLKVVMVPVVAILAGLSFPALVVYLVLHFRHRRQELLHATVQRMAEQGLPIPPELLDPPQRPPQHSPQFNAITTLGVAVGLVVMFRMLDLQPLMGIGVLVGCIGIAQLIALRLEPRSPDAGGPG